MSSYVCVRDSLIWAGFLYNTTKYIYKNSRENPQNYYGNIHISHRTMKLGLLFGVATATAATAQATYDQGWLNYQVKLPARPWPPWLPHVCQHLCGD